MQDHPAKTITQYVYSMVEINAALHYEATLAHSLSARTIATQNQTALDEEKRLNIINIHHKLNSEANRCYQHEGLQVHLCNKAPSIEGSQRQYSIHDARAFPKINVIDIGWAYEYLAEINEQVLSEVEEVQAQQKKGLEVLEATHRKYEEKLEKKEESLQRALSEIKNNRRYL